MIGTSGRAYTPLPIDASRGLPQAFPVLFGGQTYQFQLYVNVPASSIQRSTGSYHARTSITQALDDKMTSINVTSLKGFPRNTPFDVRLDNEIISVLGIAGTSWAVERGAQKSKAASHAIDAPLQYITTVLDLPLPDAHLVVKVDIQQPGAARQSVFVRKAVPDFEYEADRIALLFSKLRVAVGNLNGQGDFGTLIIGGIAPRWA